MDTIVNAVPKARPCTTLIFGASPEKRKEQIEWLKGHPQVTKVKNGGKYIDIEMKVGEQHLLTRITSKYSHLVFDPMEGLRCLTQEQFDEMYRLSPARKTAKK